MMSLNPKHINRQLTRYFNGEMTGEEMHELEKLALSDSFLKDAMDGYAENPQAIQYFNQTLSGRFNSRFKYWTIAVLSIALLVMTGLFFNQHSKLPQQEYITEGRLPIAEKNEQIKTENTSEIEVLPAAIETLRTIQVAEQINTKRVKEDFAINDTYHAEAEEENDNIVLIDPNNLLVDEELPEIIVAKKTQKKVVYPYRYFYDMAVVDYGRFENREKLIHKTVYTLSGVDASFESESARNNQELVVKTVQVGYLTYLEETLYYFSKDRYKNALKRLNIISSHFKNDLNAMFYGGLCYYNLGEFDTALQEFNAILSLKQGPFTEEAQWYKAKTLLKLERNRAAKKLLAEIILVNGYYAEQAKELMAKL